MIRTFVVEALQVEEQEVLDADVALHQTSPLPHAGNLGDGLHSGEASVISLQLSALIINKEVLDANEAEN